MEINGVAMEGLNRKQAGSSLIDYKSCELRKSPFTSAGVEPVTSSSDAPFFTTAVSTAILLIASC